MPTIGPTFGRYTLVRKVGAGGMAEVWKAKVVGPSGFQKSIAIKKVLPELAEDLEFIQMFIEEAKLVADLVHPNIVQVFDFGRVGAGEYFIAMEYVPGTHLGRVFNRLSQEKSLLPPDAAIFVTLEACKGLGAAHAKTDSVGRPLGIVHRDVSPQNILVSFGGEVKVTDFGIARIASSLPRTTAGQVRGKVYYMSPEQASGASSSLLDGRSDLFSLGIVLYELLTGVRLFAGGSAPEVFLKLAGFKPLDDAALVRIPSALRSLVRTALQPEVGNRFQTALAMEQALTNALGTDGVVQGRRALSAVVQRLFEDERMAELTPEPTSDPDELLPPTSAVATPAGVSAEEATVPSQTGKLPSGLTLNRSSVQPLAGAAGRRSQRPDPAVHTGAPPALAPGRFSRGAMAGVLMGLLLSIGAAGGIWIARNGSPPTAESSRTATPTAVAAISSSIPSPPSPTSTRVASTTPRPSSHSATRPDSVRSNPAPPVPTGTLTVFARPWVEVWVDGREVARETPLPGYSLPSGSHLLEFRNPAMGLDLKESFVVPPAGSLKLMVDVKTRTVKVLPGA